MSLGGGANSSVDNAVNLSISDGVSYAVAAGNSNRDACGYSPARAANALTIGSTTSTDARSSFSNYGSCVDWFAPGSSIVSASNTSDTATTTLSGTSMASPHAAGAAALYLQGNPAATPQQVRDSLYANTTKAVVTSASSANNHLLYVGTIDSGGTPPPTTTTPISLSARGYVKGNRKADLTWSGATGSTVDIYRNNVRIVIGTTNDGFHTDGIGGKGTGSYTYKVCYPGTLTCSNESTVTF
jgi:subtilisin family serine protease